MKKIILSVFVLFTTLVSAQHNAVTSALTKCMNYYSAHPQLSFDMNYLMYESYTSSKVIHQLSGSYKISSDKILMVLGGQKQLANSTYSIVTDETSRTMVVAERRTDKKTKTPLGIDSLVGLFGETSILKETDLVTTILFAKPKQAFYTMNKFTIDIEKTSGKVVGAVLYYAFDLNDFYEDYETTTVPRIEIKYENYTEANQYAEDVFSEGTFFKLENNTIKPTKNYNDYKLIDLRTLNKN